MAHEVYGWIGVTIVVVVLLAVLLRYLTKGL